MKLPFSKKKQPSTSKDKPPSEPEGKPSASEAIEKLSKLDLQPFPEAKRERESLIFRSYDSMNVNVGRNIK